MGTSAFITMTSCCNRNETSGNVLNEKNNDENENNINNKLGGYNTHQKIKELKAYRFFINNLLSLMMINNSVELKEFYFIKKSWIRSWYKYTCYETIRPLLIKNEINNEIDFHKLIIDHKKELHFEGFIEREKPQPLQFFEINSLNTNIKENFYIFDSNILKKFIEIYDIAENNNENKKACSLECEIGKGRIVFDVKEYILIMVLNKNWEIKQIMVIFGNENEHKQFIKNIYGRALSFIMKELKKIVEKKKMINYQKDEIFVYDDREFIKYEFYNNKNCKTNNKKENLEKNKNDVNLNKQTNKNENENENDNDNIKKNEEIL